MPEIISYEIITTPKFRKDMKLLSKRYPSIVNDIKEIISKLEKNPELGISLGKSIFKVRFRISSKNKGKSSGGRLITFVKIISNRVYLLTVYDKSDKASIPDWELDDILSNL